MTAGDAPLADSHPHEFDHVVVGGGSSGCVVAAELADAGARVLLLERGDPAEKHPETLAADGYKHAFVNDRLMIQRFSVPQPSCGGRRIFLGSGRGMGGSGSINAMVYTRGSREDFDAWGEGWRWDDVRPHFEDLERRLEVRRREPTAFTEACIRSVEAVGFRRKDDLNDGDLSGAVGYEWMNFKGGDRRSSYVAFLKGRPRPNLAVRTGAKVRRVLFDAGRRAVGVLYEKDGVHGSIRVRGEVVLCAGALETPRLLLLSGVGRGEELRALGVDVTADLPGVGQNLHDHPNVTLFFLAAHDVDCFYPQLYGFRRADGAAGPADACFVFYPARSSLREGMMRMIPAMVLPERVYRGRAPRLLRERIGAAFDRPLVERFVRRIWGIVVILGKPKSRGSVRLASSDPRDPAVVDPAYFATPEDLGTMEAGVALAREIARAAPLRELGSRELFPGPMGATARGVRSFLGQNVMTTYHYAGTCALGDGPGAVVDRRLRVRGTQGLRVADASVMPVAPVSALNAPSMMIGLRAARLLIEDARSR